MDRVVAARARLEQVAIGWHRRRVAAWAGAVLAVAALGTALAARTGVAPSVGAVTGMVVACGLAARRLRRHPITPRTAAEQADRTMPALEESATLLLADPGALPFVARLQQRHVAQALLGADAIPGIPQASARTAARVAAAAVLATATLLLLPGTGRARVTPAVGDPAVPPPAPAPTIGAVTIAWSPPSYLGMPPEERPAAEVVVPEGSAVRWRVAAEHAVALRLVDARGDTIAAVRSGSEWVAERTVIAPLLWRVEAVGADDQVVRGRDLRLGVQRDAAPTIAVLAPVGRVTLAWDEPHAVVVRALVSDDHGLGAVGLIATLARGRGEGVRFRESALGVEVESAASGARRVVSRRVDLDSLGIEPGDELFLAFTATDRKAPEPQAVRSETIFLAVRDTFDLGTGALAGVAILVEPAYFRSQRQIVLDTEALLREQRLGTVRDVVPRSLAIGLDQEALRLRYGALVGQEAEGVGEEEHDHEEAVDEDGRPVPATMEDLVHRHDMEENATLLATSVKATLRRALAAMWEAEKALRTGRPGDALPHEYEALAALEEIRLTERAYVKRIGFEPPAVDVERVRLTRAARDLGPASVAAAPRDSRSEPALREALAVLDAAASPARTAVLEEAGRRLAAIVLAGEAPGLRLEALAALRGTIEGGCASCAAAARAGLLAALPVPPPPIVPRTP